MGGSGDLGGRGWLSSQLPKVRLSIVMLGDSYSLPDYGVDLVINYNASIGWRREK